MTRKQSSSVDADEPVCRRLSIRLYSFSPREEMTEYERKEKREYKKL